MKYLFILGTLILINCKSQQMDLEQKITETVAYAKQGLPDYDNMQHLPDLYNIIISSSNCKYEILINDLLSTSFLDTSYGSVNTESMGINKDILNSGIQSLEVRLLPVNNAQTLSKYARIHVEIEHLPHLGEATGRQTILTYDSPNITEPMPVFVYKTTFKATVPYNTQTILDNAVDLSKMDAEQLYKEVNEQFEIFGDILRNGDGIAFCDFVKDRERRRAIYFYSTNEGLKAALKETIENFQQQKLLEPENKNIDIYARGKVVSLENNFGESLYWMRGEKFTSSKSLFLYKSKKDGKWYTW